MVLRSVVSDVHPLYKFMYLHVALNIESLIPLLVWEECEEYEAYFHIFSSHEKKETLLSFIVHENLYISFVY